MKNIKLAQFKPILGDTKKNTERHFQIIDKAIKDKVDIVVFPELSLTGYYLKDLVSDVAINENDKIFKDFLEKSKDISIIFGFVYEDEYNLFYNAAAFLEDGEIKHIHKKVYLPNYTMFEEARYFASGETFTAFDTKNFKAGLLICEDALHLSSLYILSQQGVHTLFVISNSPVRGAFDDDLYSKKFWNTTLEFISGNLTMNVIFVNRAGIEDGISFWGGSSVYSALGNKILELPLLEEKEEIIKLETDLVRRARINSPYYRDEKHDIMKKFINEGGN
jgi:predicted amidohydrolase